jgi:serine O-acetyltransferase
MKYFLEKIYFYISFFRCIPHIIVFLLIKNKITILADVNRWNEILMLPQRGVMGLVYLLTFRKEFRNLFYYRVGFFGSCLNIIYSEEKTLFINVKSIGAGLYIEHGFSTIILAHSLGENCWINQQVTIGFNNNDMPTIGDNVKITAGAKVIGGVNLGNNVVVGANCVVLKNIPDNCTVVGIPARIVKKNGLRVDEKL